MAVGVQSDPLSSLRWRWMGPWMYGTNYLNRRTLLSVSKSVLNISFSYWECLPLKCLIIICLYCLCFFLLHRFVTKLCTASVYKMKTVWCAVDLSWEPSVCWGCRQACSDWRTMRRTWSQRWDTNTPSFTRANTFTL